MGFKDFPQKCVVKNCKITPRFLLLVLFLAIHCTCAWTASISEPDSNSNNDLSSRGSSNSTFLSSSPSIATFEQHSPRQSLRGRRGWNRRGSRNIKGTAPVSSSRSIRADGVNVAPTISRQWLELETVPPTTIRAKLHGEVVLECEAVGSPPPLIYWLKNGQPIDILLSFDSEEMVNGLDTRDSLLERRSYGNFVPSSFAMAKIKSKLPLRCIRPEEEAEYSCAADNFSHQLIASTNVVIEEDDPSEEWRPECEFRLPVFLFNMKFVWKGTKAYVHVAESFHMEAIGKNIILPCRGGGKPKPQISWTRADGQWSHLAKNFR